MTRGCGSGAKKRDLEIEAVFVISFMIETLSIRLLSLVEMMFGCTRT